MASVVVKLLQARGSLSQRQSAAANKLLWTLLHRPPVDYLAARHAIGRSGFAIIEAVIVLGQPISRYATRTGIPHAHAAGRLKIGLDVLADHFESAYPAITGPAANASRRATG